MQVLQLSLGLSFLWTLSCGQTCTSAGSDAGSSCSRSRPCRADHPLEDVECVPHPVLLPLPSSPLPAGITRCPVRWWGEVLRCEYPKDEEPNNFVADSGNITVSAELNSIDFRHFAMNVSWSHPHNYSGGYEVRVKEEGYVVDCYCVSDPDMRSLYMDNQLTYSYHTASGNINVEVILLTDALPKNSTSASIETKWPGSCLDVRHDESTCGLPVYGPPSDVVVFKHFSRSSEVILDIQWRYKTIFPLPEVYYVEVYNIHDIFDFYTFVVKNASSVLISYLDPSVQYGVRVQPYVHCSGLANRSYSLGCGLWSRTVTPLLNHITGQKLARIKPSRKRN